MTQKQHSAKEAVDWKEIFRSDQDGMRALIQQVVEEVLEAEMDEAVGAQKSERTETRVGYRAGHYTRKLVTRVGKLVLRVPQDRQGRFRTEVFDRYQRSEKALVSALAEMYVQGVSTRKVKEITEELCGHEFSSSAISRMTGKDFHRPANISASISAPTVIRSSSATHYPKTPLRSLISARTSLCLLAKSPRS